MTAPVVRSTRRGAGAWFACFLSACSSEVSVQILPGDNSSTGQDGGCASNVPCSGRTWALAFVGPYDRVEVPSSPWLDLPQDFTIEAWVLIDSYAGGHGVFNRWLSTVGDIQLTFGTPEILSRAELPIDEPVPSHTLATWGFVRPGLWITTYTTILPAAGVWHHIASSYGAGALKLYVDGARWATARGTDRIANPDAPLFIGATSRAEQPIDPTLGERWWPPIQGFIAEVRMSSRDRYPTEFVPEHRLSADPDTIALWHLDEGTGSAASESGPNRLNGTIVGATWVRAPSP
jgi:Concanavalin A-like lectin/glucanases superfamily